MEKVYLKCIEYGGGLADVKICTMELWNANINLRN